MERGEFVYDDYVKGNHKHMKGYDKTRMTCASAAQDGHQHACFNTYYVRNVA
jgi:hypothetical protein